MIWTHFYISPLSHEIYPSHVQVLPLSAALTRCEGSMSDAYAAADCGELAEGPSASDFGFRSS
jgi:hypothetical protein